MYKTYVLYGVFRILYKTCDAAHRGRVSRFRTPVFAGKAPTCPKVRNPLLPWRQRNLLTFCYRGLIDLQSVRIDRRDTQKIETGAFIRLLTESWGAVRKDHAPFPFPP